MSIPFWHSVIYLVLVAGTLGCGAPAPGGACVGQGTGTCTSASVALFCDKGRTVEIQCRGAVGCGASGGHMSCDQTKPQPGDACLSTNEGASGCDPANGNQALVCTSGKFKAIACTNCSATATQIRCQ